MTLVSQMNNSAEKKILWLHTDVESGLILNYFQADLVFSWRFC